MELPATLDALVPKYISAVPRDPFDGKPLRYDSKKKIVYSVGYNLKDDGGMAKYFLLDINKANDKDQIDLVLPILK